MNYLTQKEACEGVANDWRALAWAIYEEDGYASHVPESTKIYDLKRMIADSERIAQGEVKSFTIWQRVHEKMTSECIAFLSN